MENTLADAVNPAEPGTAAPAPSLASDGNYGGRGHTLEEAEKRFLDKLTTPAQPVEAKEPAGEQSTEANPPEAEPQSPPEQDDPEPDTSDAESATEEPEDDTPADLPETMTLEDLASALDTDPAELAKRLKVKTDDGEVSLEDLRLGQLREADYRKKTMRLAEKEKAVEANIQQRDTELKTREQFLDVALRTLAADLDAGPSDQQLLPLLDPHSASYNPDEYHRLRALRDGKLQRFSAVAGEIQKQRAQAEQAQKEAIAQHQQAQRAALIRAKPDLKDAKAQQAFNARLVEYLTGDAGFTGPQVQVYFSGAYDHRHILMIEKAQKYDELNKRKGDVKKLVKVPKVQVPGSGQAKSTEADKGKQLRERLKSTGRRDDALALLRHRFKEK